MVLPPLTEPHIGSFSISRQRSVIQTPRYLLQDSNREIVFFFISLPFLIFQASLSLSLSLCFASLVKYFSRVWASFVSPSCCLKYPERGSDRENDGGEGAKIGSVSKQISFRFEGNPLMYFTPCSGLFNTLKLLFYDPLIINGFIKEIKSYRTQTVFISFCARS